MTQDYSTEIKASFSDIFVKYIGYDFRNEDILEEIDESCLTLLSFYSKDYLGESPHFSYNIDVSEDGGEVVVKPNNILTALWFNGVYPENGLLVMRRGRYENLGKKYIFNKKTKKLIWK